MRVLVLAVLALAGCDSAPQPFTTQDGNKGYLVECSGTWDSWTNCYTQARQLCSGDYRELRRTDYVNEGKPVRTLELVCSN